MAKAMSLDQFGTWFSFPMFIVLLVVLLFVFFLSSVSRSRSELGDYHSEDNRGGRYDLSDVGHCLCPELVPQADVTGVDQVYALQHPGLQVPGEMVINKSNGELVARVRAGGAGGALLVLVAPGGAVLATCEEVKTKDVPHWDTSSSYSEFLLVKDRLGRPFAEIFDKGYIEARLGNGKRITVVHQTQTGAMSVVNERRQLMATLEPAFHDDGSHDHLTLWPQSRHLYVALKILPGADLGMILLTLLAHSCFDRRRAKSPTVVEAPPLLRIAP